MNMDADVRLYAGAIALVSGIYSMAAALGNGADMMPTGDTVMLLIGLIVIVHGIALLTPFAARLGRASGPLMVLWAAIMLGNQLWAATMSSGSMMASSWDGGMIAVATLMLASGLIMVRRNQA